MLSQKKFDVKLRSHVLQHLLEKLSEEGPLIVINSLKDGALQIHKLLGYSVLFFPAEGCQIYADQTIIIYIPTAGHQTSFFDTLNNICDRGSLNSELLTNFRLGQTIS
ncbi:MAG: hypothetical protein BGO39_27295 [Chloroflexi bacterium 54-19]|nr:MAG: hypothetical protein BGO39_27295 [Chloroflexi bacterium 54-19]